MSLSRLSNCNMYGVLSLISCAVVQGTLLVKESVLQETRNAMEELCRTMQILIIEHLISAFRFITVMNRKVLDSCSWQTTEAVKYAIHSAYTYLINSRSTFEDVAESCKPYLLKCLSSLWLVVDKIILMQIYCTYAIYFSTPSWSALTSLNTFQMVWFYPTRAYKSSYKFRLLHSVKTLFENPNVFGWFLSIRGPGAEEYITKLLEAIDDPSLLNPASILIYKRQFSCAIEHRLGVDLLAPRHERLHFENAGLTKHPSTGTRASEPPLTLQQRKSWTNAFETLTRNLS